MFCILLPSLLCYCIKGANAVSRENISLSPNVQQLSDDYWNWKIRDRPQFATVVGIQDYDDQLDDLSEEGYQKRYDQVLQFLDRASNLEDSLSQEQDIINIRILINELNTFKDGFPHKGFYFQVSYLEGVQNNYLSYLFELMPRKSKENYNNILARMGKIPIQLDQIIHLMRKGVEIGKTYHNTSLKGVKESIETHVVSDATQSPFYKSLFMDDTFPDNLTQDDIQEIQQKVRQIILDNISPSFERMLNFFNSEYETRPEIAITSIPDGESFYAQLIRYHTNTNYSPREIHEIGLNQVEEIQKEMIKIIKELGHGNMSVSKFSEMIRNDQKNFYDTSKELLARFDHIIQERILPKLDTLFNYIPKTELKVASNPNPNAPGGVYYAGSYDGSRPGVFKANTINTALQPKYSLMTLSLHEGYPGHHLQITHNIESPEIPFFRRVADDRFIYPSPSNTPLNTAFVEGWALYSESLGFEMGLYEDLLERYGHYSDEILRACRLVVDTGMHALDWSKERAVKFMLDNTADSEVAIRNEIDRYITWPGQALGYKIGELRIQELRTRAEDHLGDLFHIKEFHDVILDSAGPLEVVEGQVDQWIQKTLNDGSPRRPTDEMGSNSVTN